MKYLNKLATKSRKTRKTVTIIGMVTIGLSAYFLSCEEQKQEDASVQQTIDFEQIGIEHNKALDAAFEMLKAMKKDDGVPLDNIGGYFDLLESSTIDFTLQNHPELSDLAIDELKRTEGDMKRSLNVFIEGLDREGENKHLHYQMLSDAQHLITRNQNTYLEKIIMETTNSDGDIDSMIENFNRIEAEIRANSLNNELPVLLTALSIAKHSSQYWNDNHSKWAEEFGESSIFAKTEGGCPVRWGEVAAADVAAAVTIGVSASSALIVPFIGWGAWIAGTVGGTALVSGGGALLHYFGDCLYVPSSASSWADADYPSAEDFLFGGNHFLSPDDLIIYFPG